MTTENIITIALSLGGVLFSFLGALRTQKAYKMKKRKRIARMKRNREQIMSTLMEDEIPSVSTEDDATSFSDVEKLLLANSGRHYPDKYEKLKKGGKLQYKILTDDFDAQRQERQERIS